MSKKEGFEKKNWGYEITWANNENYCGKIMVFEKTGSKFSMHFHKEKDESWFVNSGKFFVRYIDTQTGTLHEKILKEGETWRNLPLVPHQLEAIEPGSTIYEVSTTDTDNDIFRISAVSAR